MSCLSKLWILVYIKNHPHSCEIIHKALYNWWLSFNPFAKYAQVKLDHFQFRVKIHKNIFETKHLHQKKHETSGQIRKNPKPGGVRAFLGGSTVTVKTHGSGVIKPTDFSDGNRSKSPWDRLPDFQQQVRAA